MGVAEPLARRESHGFPGPVDFGDPRPGQELDVVVAVERLRPQQQQVEADLAVQVVLRQRRALIGQHILVADQRDASVIAMLAQRRRQLEASMARADDDDCFSGHQPPAIRSGSPAD